MVSVPMVYKDKRLLYDPDAIIKAITDKTKIIVIANPNNPTGNFMDAKDFVRIAETASVHCRRGICRIRRPWDVPGGLDQEI